MKYSIFTLSKASIFIGKVGFIAIKNPGEKKTFSGILTYFAFGIGARWAYAFLTFLQLGK